MVRYRDNRGRWRDTKSFINFETNVVVHQREPEYVGGGRECWTFYEDGSGVEVAEVDFSIDEIGNALTIHVIVVHEHSNIAAARNKYKGLGRLLIYIVCEYTKEICGYAAEFITINLTALNGTAGFYRPMGLHSVGYEQRILDPLFERYQVNLVRPQRIPQDWLTAFDASYRDTRKCGPMVAEVNTVMANIELKTLAPWEEYDD